MNLILYGTASDKAELRKALSALPAWCYRTVYIADYQEYDSYVAGLGEGTPDCVVVTMNEADGMEGVIAARHADEHVPVLWFSDDKGFGVQSYRLGCAYFHQKPIRPEILSVAMSKCGIP